MYASLSDLSLRLSPGDLAEAAAKEDHAVQGEHLAAGIAGEPVADNLQAAVAAAIARLNQFLADATAEINGYISSRYPVLEDPPQILTTLCVDIAIYRLIPGFDEHSLSYLNYKNALAYLSKVAMGKIDLQPATSATVPDQVQVASEAPVFSNDKLKGYSEPLYTHSGLYNPRRDFY